MRSSDSIGRCTWLGRGADILVCRGRQVLGGHALRGGRQECLPHKPPGVRAIRGDFLRRIRVNANPDAPRRSAPIKQLI